jgi:NDP-sugar pyrophosphorylase family protein
MLTAGLGTRLAPLTQVRAKPAMPIAGEPLARRLVRWLAIAGVTDIVANLHHLPATITGVLGDGSDLGARVRYSWEQPQILGSGGGPRQALDIIGAERFVIVNGDTLTTLDLDQMSRSHHEAASAGAVATLALVPNRRYLHYGGVLVNEQGWITGFVPRGAAAAGSFHFIGVQIVESSAFRPLAVGRPHSTIGGLYNELIAARAGSIRAFLSDTPYWDVGTVSDYWRTWWAFAGDQPAGASILWDDVTIGAGSVLDECIVTDGVQVPPGRHYRRQVLLNHGGAVTAVPFDPSSES